jgi:thiol-disulfide isomerase/thioredoxin
VCALLAAILLIGGLSGCLPKHTIEPDEQPPIDNSFEVPPHDSAQIVKEGLPAPDFEFITIDGTKEMLSDYRGRPVLLNFWATWCGYCLEEMPDMQEISERHPHIAVLAITRNDDSAAATRFFQDNGYSFVCGLDEDGYIAHLYPTSGIPYSVIIDKEGIVVAIFEGSAPDMYSYFMEALRRAGA